MAIKGETALQERIQKYIRKRGGYVCKNWGNMISAPGIADLTVCYKGYYLAIEVKDGNNIPSKAQGIHCREVQAAGGITLVAWTLENVTTTLDIIDSSFDESVEGKLFFIKEFMHSHNLDDGTRW